MWSACPLSYQNALPINNVSICTWANVFHNLSCSLFSILAVFHVSLTCKIYLMFVFLPLWWINSLPSICKSAICTSVSFEQLPWISFSNVPCVAMFHQFRNDLPINMLSNGTWLNYQDSSSLICKLSSKQCFIDSFNISLHWFIRLSINIRCKSTSISSIKLHDDVYSMRCLNSYRLGIQV